MLSGRFGGVVAGVLVALIEVDCSQRLGGNANGTASDKAGILDAFLN